MIAPATMPSLTEHDVDNVVRCVRHLSRMSGLTDFECLALLEEFSRPLSPVDRATVVARITPPYAGITIH
jgi:hypothetical protein